MKSGISLSEDVWPKPRQFVHLTSVGDVLHAVDQDGQVWWYKVGTAAGNHWKKLES